MLLFRLKRYIKCTIIDEKTSYTKFINLKQILHKWDREWNKEGEKIYQRDNIKFRYCVALNRSYIQTKKYTLTIYHTPTQEDVKYKFDKFCGYNLVHTVYLDIKKKILRTKLCIDYCESIYGIAKIYNYSIVYDDKNILSMTREHGRHYDSTIYRYFSRYEYMVYKYYGK